MGSADVAHGIEPARITGSWAVAPGRRRGLTTLIPWFLPVALALAGSSAGAAERPLAEEVRRHAAGVADQVVSWRRHIHAHPELSNREKETGAYVAAALKELGVDEVRTGVARHGVVGIIRGEKPGGVVALRADMDALPVSEATGLPFASTREGVMHACGHDAHTAILLGAAAVLVKMKSRLPGTVKLVFQPAEEGPPAGEKGGAPLMIEEGVLAGPKPDAMFALHVYHDLPTGTIGYRAGALYASVDRFRVTVRGKQTHASSPWEGRDPIVAAAQIVTALQAIPSRMIDARKPVVISVGVLEGGTRWNIIPGEVRFEGTVRTLDPEAREQVAEAFRRVVEKTAAAHGASAEITYEDMAPVVWNDPELTRSMLPALRKVAGDDGLVEVDASLGGEDFGWFARQVPGLYVRLGGAFEGRENAPHHTPTFDIDEDALPVGVRAMSLLALEFLHRRRSD